MHFTETSWRPTYESKSALLQVTSGNIYNGCKFYGWHDEGFCQLQIEEIIEDLQELRKYTPYAERVFITGGSLIAMPFNFFTTELTV